MLPGASLLHRRCAPVPDPTRGRHEHPCTREPRAPAEVDVVGTGRSVRVETSEHAEQIGPHEHHRVGHEEHVADAVVLFLVDLARLDGR
ncbi:MAG TPA: hypothetical protein VGJ70_11845, partial [Solirubrobacteraceae bacterium]